MPKMEFVGTLGMPRKDYYIYAILAINSLKFMYRETEYVHD